MMITTRLSHSRIANSFNYPLDFRKYITMYKQAATVFFTAFILLSSSISLASDNVQTDANGVTLAGYDAVSYFTEHAAVTGSAKYTSVYNNAIYYFSSSKNRDLFNTNPEAYAPQYGGFCAYGASVGKKFDIDGKAFEVFEGKLYVNKNPDVYKIWAEEKVERIDTANTEWQKIQNTSIKDL